MALILNIDSAFETCNVALGNNEEVIAHENSMVQKDHASFLQPAIKRILFAAGINLSAIDAIAVSNGPGSYTGLRVGLSSAKGICYVLNKPLILLNTLDVIAFALRQNMQPQNDVLICPMIDARRMEVFTALYNSQLTLIQKHTSVILDNLFLLQERQTHEIIFGGNGSSKLKDVQGFENITCNTLCYSINDLIVYSFKAYQSKNFADIAYSEPFYFKPAYVK